MLSIDKKQPRVPLKEPKWELCGSLLDFICSLFKTRVEIGPQSNSMGSWGRWPLPSWRDYWLPLSQDGVYSPWKWAPGSHRTGVITARAACHKVRPPLLPLQASACPSTFPTALGHSTKPPLEAGPMGLPSFQRIEPDRPAPFVTSATWHSVNSRSKWTESFPHEGEESEDAQGREVPDHRTPGCVGPSPKAGESRAPQLNVAPRSSRLF